MDRLIWGRFGEREVGIGRMMDIADAYGVALTFFVDYCESARYPGEFERITAEIVRRGHDAQIHAHQLQLPDDFFANHGLTPAPRTLEDYDEPHARVLVEHLVQRARECGATPVAFRGGAFEFNANILDAMRAQGLQLSFNYNVARTSSPASYENLSVFRWWNEILEVSVPQLFYEGKARRFSIDSMNFADEVLVDDYITRYFRTFPDGILAMIMHSFSFCDLNRESGHFEYRDDRKEKAFSAFLSRLVSSCAVVTARDLARDHSAGALGHPPQRGRDFLETYTAGLAANQRPKPRSDSVVTPATSLDASTTVTPASAAAVTSICNICGTSRALMQDYHKRRKVHCPKCGSLERQRVFVEAYKELIEPEFSLEGKRVLHVSPSRCVKTFLAPLTNLVTADVRPIGCDLQLDVCNMAPVANDSFDAIVAKAVLQHVYDDDAALDEMRRVLKPGGRLLLQVHHRINAYTERAVDQTEHYGNGNLDAYKVGTYRIYGDLSLLPKLQARFLVKTFHARDPISGTLDCIFSCMKPSPLLATAGDT